MSNAYTYELDENKSLEWEKTYFENCNRIQSQKSDFWHVF